MKDLKIIEFCSKSSLWIYLWHVLIIFLLNTYYNYINWKIKYVIIVLGSIGITFMQNKVIDLSEKTKINKNLLKVFRG